MSGFGQSAHSRIHPKWRVHLWRLPYLSISKFLTWCNIPKPPIFQYKQGRTQMEYLFVYALGCAVHHLACTVKPRGVYRKGESIYIRKCGVVKYCENGNVTSDMLKLRRSARLTTDPKIFLWIMYFTFEWTILFHHCYVWIASGVICLTRFRTISPTFPLIMNLLTRNKDKKHESCMLFSKSNQLNTNRYART